jgi:hypothetical protein
MGLLSTATIVREIDDEATALNALRLVLGAAKMAAAELMRHYPDYAALGQAVIDFASDGESDIAGALAALEDRMPRYSDRGGAT